MPASIPEAVLLILLAIASASACVLTLSGCGFFAPATPQTAPAAQYVTSADQRVGHRQLEDPRQIACQQLRLVVAARSAALRVERDGDQGCGSGHVEEASQHGRGGARQDGRQPRGAGVLQRGHRAARRAVVGEGGHRKRQRLTGNHPGIGHQEAIRGP